MSNEQRNLVSYKSQNNQLENPLYSVKDAIKEFDELKNIALNCFDKNGNPNISAAIRAIENKAKVAGLYSQNKNDVVNVVKMNEIMIDGQQLRLDIGDEFF